MYAAVYSVIHNHFQLNVLSVVISASAFFNFDLVQEVDYILNYFMFCLPGFPLINLLFFISKNCEICCIHYYSGTYYGTRNKKEHNLRT